jgi:hypothetical protein
MRFVIGITALLVLASIFGSIAGLLFLSERSSNLVHSEQRAIYPKTNIYG